MFHVLTFTPGPNAAAIRPSNTIAMPCVHVTPVQEQNMKKKNIWTPNEIKMAKIYGLNVENENARQPTHFYGYNLFIPVNGEHRKFRSYFRSARVHCRSPHHHVHTVSRVVCCSVDSVHDCRGERVRCSSAAQVNFGIVTPIGTSVTFTDRKQN